jgi:hypothetical protein
MRKILSAVVVAGFVAALGGVAEAKDMTNMKGLGWYTQEAPIGGIIWFGPKMGITAGIGFDKVSLPGDAEDPDTRITFAGAVPIVLAGADDVNFMFRPGIIFRSKPAPPTVDSSFEVDLDLAVEFWITSRASILGAAGVHFESESPEDGDSTTFLGTHAMSATEVGFYYYFVK